MKHLFLPGKLLLIVFLLFNSPAKPQGTPFICDGKFFISHGNANTPTSQTFMEQVTFPAPGSVVVVNFPLSSSNTGFNGIGMNPVDGYIYGFTYPATNGPVNLVRIGIGSPNNIIQNLGAVTTPGPGSDLNNGEYVYAASFRKDGLLYFVTNTNELYSLTTAELAAGAGNREAVHIANLNGTGNNAPPSLGMADLGVDPTNNDVYAVSVNGGTNPTALFRVNVTTGALTRVGVYAAPAGDFIAGLFFTESGVLYGYRSDGTFQQFDKTNATFTLVGNPPVYDFADGCSCVYRIAHDLNAPVQLCPTAINPQPVFNFTLSVFNNYQAVSGITYDLTLDNRYTFNQNITTIRAGFTTAGITSTGGSITSVNGGTNNKLQITGISIPYVFPASIPNITIEGRLISPTNTLVNGKFYSTFSGLPVSLGSSDFSNDPKTVQPDDTTIITMCPNITLPAKLISFYGAYKNGYVFLDWMAENEVNLIAYEIERSINGTEYFPVAVKPAKNSGGRVSYQMSDDLAGNPADAFYYRLKIKDIDDRYKYSSVIVIKKNNAFADNLSISPNPVGSADNITIRIKAAKKTSVELKVTDMSGKILLARGLNLYEGVNNISLPEIKILPPGIYLLQSSDEQQTSTIKFIVAK